MGAIAVREGRAEDVGAPQLLRQLVGPGVHDEEGDFLVDDVRPERVRHRRADDAAEDVHALPFHQLARLGQPLIRLAASLALQEHLDRAAAGLVTDLAPVEQEAIPEIEAELRREPGVRVDEADLDRTLGPGEVRQPQQSD
jgi:hypothetical protein